MKTYLAIDLGGSAVKYGVVTDDATILSQGSFKTITDDFDALTNALKELYTETTKTHSIDGLAVSAPGSVDSDSGVIGGVSAIPCIHGPNLMEEWNFGVPVSVMNDANCAALCETWIGATSDVDDSVFIVIGTGIGGAIVKDKQVHIGKHQHGGEFGYMIADVSAGQIYSYSDLASTSGLIKNVFMRHNKVLTGKEVFDDKETYQKSLDTFFFYNAKLINDLQYAYDPQRVVLGGGVSANPYLLEGIKKQLQYIYENGSIGTIMPDVVVAKYRNDANLIGAVYFHITR